MVVVGGHAWPTPVNGVYPKVGAKFNHCYLDFALPAFRAFDNYPDVWDGDFIKNLAPDYDQTDFGYRTIVSIIPHDKVISIHKPLKKSLWQELKEFFRWYFGEILK
jgi:hypothetical protein